MDRICVLWQVRRGDACNILAVHACVNLAEQWNGQRIKHWNGIWYLLPEECLPMGGSIFLFFTLNDLLQGFGLCCNKSNAKKQVCCREEGVNE